MALNNAGEHPPEISVIIPVYNGERTIMEAVRSALWQTARDLEVLVVDDCSNDTTTRLIELTGDARLRLVRNEKNLGVAQSRNRGLALARGKFIAFLDADDIWEPEKLRKQRYVLEKTGADICYSSYAFITPQGKKTGRTYLVPPRIDYTGLLKENVIGCSTTLIRAESLRGFAMDERFYHEDYVLWLELLRNGRTAAGVRDVLVYYRVGGRSENKLAAARHRWDIYRRSQGLGVLRASRYMCSYAVSAAKKYW